MLVSFVWLFDWIKFMGFIERIYFEMMKKVVMVKWLLWKRMWMKGKVVK